MGAITQDQEIDGADFYLVSTAKFLIMDTITFGVYQLYWWYRQWRAIQLREMTGIIPVLRAFFAVFFVFGFSKRAFPQKAVPLSLCFYALVLCQVTLSLLLPGYELVGFFIQMLWYILVQEKLNQRVIRQKPDVLINNQFSPLNVIGILAFIIFIAMLVLS